MVDMGVLLGDRNHQGNIYAGSRRCLFALTHQSTKLYPAFLTSEFQRWYPPRDLSVESIPNRFSKILKPPHLSVGSI
jgi:hypothetical protein